MNLGQTKPWKDRNIKNKFCRRCQFIFQPSCGGNIYCPPCSQEHKRESHALGARAWRAKNPERHYKHKADWDLKKKFGITLEDYFILLKGQGNQCAICKTAKPKGRGKTRKFVVDHCHRTKKVRGLLCSLCNTAIGLLREDTKNFNEAIKYLEAFNG